MFSRYTAHLVRGALPPSAPSSPLRPMFRVTPRITSLQLNSRMQVARHIHVASVTRSKVKEPQGVAVTVTHSHPTAEKTNKKTYDIDVMFSDDEYSRADVCWKFQFAEGEDRLERLRWYAHAFGKRGTGDEDYDDYVRKFQSTVNTMVMLDMFLKSKGKAFTIEGDVDGILELLMALHEEDNLNWYAKYWKKEGDEV